MFVFCSLAGKPQNRMWWPQKSQQGWDILSVLTTYTQSFLTSCCISVTCCKDNSQVSFVPSFPSRLKGDGIRRFIVIINNQIHIIRYIEHFEHWFHFILLFFLLVSCSTIVFVLFCLFSLMCLKQFYLNKMRFNSFSILSLYLFLCVAIKNILCLLTTCTYNCFWLSVVLISATCFSHPYISIITSSVILTLACPTKVSFHL